MAKRLFSRKWQPHGKGIGRFGVVAGVLLLAVLIGVRYLDPPPVEILRHQLFDFYQRIDPPEIKELPIVIVDIDEASLDEIGQWPWPRPVLAQLIRNLAGGGAIVTGFDVIFAEPDRVSPPMLADSMTGIDTDIRDYLRGLPDHDATFAAVIGKTRTVLGQAGLSESAGLNGEAAPKRASFAELGGDPRPDVYTFRGLVRNVPLLEQAAHGLGMISLIPERDGITRRVPLVLNVDGTLVPTLSIEMLRLATGQSTIAVRRDDAGISNIVVAGVAIPTDSAGRLWIRFSKQKSVPYIPAKDVVDGTVEPSSIAGKFAFIGTSAAGLLDIKTTPLAAAMPGVEVHAQLLANVLGQNLLFRPNYMKATEIAITILIAVMILILTPRLSAMSTLFFGSSVMIVLGGVSWYLYSAQGLLFDITAMAVTTFAIYALLTYVKYAREEADKKMVRRTFSQYLAPAVVDRLAEHPEDLKLGGETRNMTILFSDIRGFTTIAEHTDATELTTLINRILTPMTKAVLDNQGTVDKYIGDCLMAFWNAPLDDDDHARNGCLAALDMIRRVAEVNATLREEAAAEDKEAPPEIRIGVGLNSGSCCVGNIGSEQRFDYSVLGDSVNLASRLEGQTSFYGVPIVVGETTAAAASDMALVSIDRLRVKGRQQPVEIRALVGDAEFAAQPAYQEFKVEHDAFMAAYFGQDWQVALDKAAHCRSLAAALELPLDGFYTLFDERIRTFLDEDLGDDWDGVFVATKK